MKKEISKMDESVSIDRFEAVTEAKLIKALDKIFTQTNNTTEQDAVSNKYNICVDPANVCMCIAKTEQGKRVISRFVDRDNIPRILPTKCLETIGDSKYSTDYLVNVINVLKVTGNYIQFKLGTDSPAAISNEHFEFWLAPRIESE